MSSKKTLDLLSDSVPKWFAEDAHSDKIREVTLREIHNEIFIIKNT